MGITPNAVVTDLKSLDPNRFCPPVKHIWDEVDELSQEIYGRIGAKDPLTVSFIKVCVMMMKVFDRKQRSYGPGNIAKFADFGVLVRMNDKIERLRTLYSKGKDPNDEGRDDSFGDCATYSVIALMNRWGLWPGVVGDNPKKEGVSE